MEPILIPSQRAKQRADTRQKIISAALLLFEDKGFIESKTQELATMAGVSHGLIFAHFKTKDDLLLAVANQFLSQVDLLTRKALRESRTLEELLHAHLFALARYEKLYTRFIQEKHLLPEKVQSLLVEINSAVSSHLKTVIVNEKNKIHLGIKEQELFFLFNCWLGLVHHYLMNANLFAHGKSVIAEKKNEMVSTFIRLIAQKKGK